MDIYKYAEEYNADYYDMNTGRTYHVQEYNNAVKLGLPTQGIRVTDAEGKFVGYVVKNDNTR